jgi:predicted kinase
MDNKSLRVVICKGLPASGKSTWAKEFIGKNPRWKRINKDSLRAMVDNSKFSRENEKLIEQARDALLRLYLAQGYNVIIDDTNLHPKQPAAIRRVVDDFNSVQAVLRVEVEEKFFEVTLDEALQRNALRSEAEGRVPAEAIKRMHRNHLHQELDRFAYRDFLPGLPTIIICDIDGTVAIPKHRDVYNTAECGTDEPNTPVIEIIQKLQQDGEHPSQPGITVIFMSGREDQFRPQTMEWLIYHGLLEECHGDGHLHMRATGDHRNDGIVKRELFEQHIAGKYNVLCVFDDRNRVVKVWRELGLCCMQVADGDF